MLFGLPTFTSHRLASAISLQAVSACRFLIAFALSHHRPRHPCDLVGECDSRNLGRSPHQAPKAMAPTCRVEGAVHSIKTGLQLSLIQGQNLWALSAARLGMRCLRVTRTYRKAAIRSGDVASVLLSGADKVAHVIHAARAEPTFLHALRHGIAIVVALIGSNSWPHS
jgi:hypothetical protein